MTSKDHQKIITRIIIGSISIASSVILSWLLLSLKILIEGPLQIGNKVLEIGVGLIPFLLFVISLLLILSGSILYRKFRKEWMIYGILLGVFLFFPSIILMYYGLDLLFY